MPDDIILIVFESQELEPCLLRQVPLRFFNPGHRDYELETKNQDQSYGLVEHQNVPHFE